MSELILHQYAMSPFSEKIRTMLGYTGQSWKAVTVREMPPRPDLEPLADGYRKIPVAQIGADVFCDTRTISREIARMSGKPELALENNSQEVQDFVREVDLQIFLACIVSSSGGGLLIKLIRNTSIIDAYKFLKDRIEMGKKSKVRSVSPKQAKARVAEHVADLEKRLTRDFLFGDKPCIADFSAYHGLWFVCDVAEKDVLKNAPRVSAWMERIRAFGHGSVEEISGDQALEVAHATLPRPLPSSNANGSIGQTVRVAPDDYGREPITGTLVADDGTSWIIAHEHPRVGTVNIHVPQQGFSLKDR
ncbi:glutathione S-transferase family protein [Marinobacter fonticola]|uniref:glutathione S-transferase family protein n=1 Tax=Marinobacter fonticola TaxID=2603215 RepID=UPI0011E83492|nr:glutathione S-transferase family protein [Marinobacter fonticola]